jgi:hypothetical protein
MSLWRKRKTSDTNCDTIAQNVHHNGQNQPKLFTMTAMTDNDLSIKSDDLSIKSEKAICEVQRLGQEIEQEPAAWYRDEDGIRIYYETKVWDDCTPLYTTPQQRTWVGLTEEERNHARQNVTYSQLAMTISEWADAVQIETEQKLKEKNK